MIHALWLMDWVLTISRDAPLQGVWEDLTNYSHLIRLSDRMSLPCTVGVSEWCAKPTDQPFGW